MIIYKYLLVCIKLNTPPRFVSSRTEINNNKNGSSDTNQGED
jgi:hypothetical protein